MINVGSDFSGIGAFDQALTRLGIDYKTVFACDMDKYARESFIANYGEPAYYPKDVYEREIPTTPLDIYMSSPPCQAFSLAGKRKGEDDKRGILFYNTHEFIIKNNPRYFIIENVKGLLSDSNGSTFRKWVDLLGGKSVNGKPVLFPLEDSAPYHIYYKVINAKDQGVPQNRERVFIVGIRDDQDNSFLWPKDLPLTKRLKDVIEKDVPEKYFLSDKMVEGFTGLNLNGAARTIRTGGKASMTDKHNWDLIKVGYINQDTQASQVIGIDGTSPNICAGTHGYANGYLKVPSTTSKGYELASENDSINFSQPNSKTRRGRVGRGVAQTLDTQCNQAVICAMRGCNPENPKSRKSGLPTVQQIEINHNGVSNSLTTVQKDNLVLLENYAQWDASGKGYASQQDRTYYENGFMGCLAASNGGNKHNVMLNDYRIRRLTPRECFRLMDFPESFKFTVSDTQLYKQAGNSIVISCLENIIKQLKLD